MRGSPILWLDNQFPAIGSLPICAASSYDACVRVFVIFFFFSQARCNTYHRSHWKVEQLPANIDFSISKRHLWFLQVFLLPFYPSLTVLQMPAGHILISSRFEIQNLEKEFCLRRHKIWLADITCRWSDGNNLEQAVSQVLSLLFLQLRSSPVRECFASVSYNPVIFERLAPMKPHIGGPQGFVRVCFISKASL